MKQKMAVIGTGIAGMSAAYFLHKDYDLTVFEKKDYIGGHSNTIDVKKPEEASFDTGFMVFNFETYPNLVKLFKKLDVKIKKSDMSFSVQNKTKGLEYSGSSLNHLFSQRKNLLNPSYYKFLMEINRFNQNAPKLLEGTRNEYLTIGEYIENERYSLSFLEDYLIPMSSAVWSTPPNKMLNFPVTTLVQFFFNHGFLGLNTQHQWYTVDGGSRNYCKKLTKPFAEKIHINSAVRGVFKEKDGSVSIQTDDGKQIFDKVVLACHGDEALRMLQNPTEQQLKILTSFRYEKNRATVHTDTSLMPSKKMAWSSWNYIFRKVDNEISASTVYYMNKLQGVSNKNHFFISINGEQEIDQDKILKVIDYDHPLFDIEAIKAQKLLPSLNNDTSIYFTGSYFRYGFHEDALLSSVNLCESILKRSVI